MRLEVFYAQHKDELVAILTRYAGDREAAADAVQEFFLRALNNYTALSAMQEKTLWSWLYTAAKNALIDKKRKTSRTAQHEAFDDADTGMNPDDAILVKRDREGDNLYVASKRHAILYARRNGAGYGRYRGSLLQWHDFRAGLRKKPSEQ